MFGWLVVPIIIAYYLSRTGRYESAHVLSSLALTGLVTSVAGLHRRHRFFRRDLAGGGAARGGTFGVAPRGGAGLDAFAIAAAGLLLLLSAISTVAVPR